MEELEAILETGGAAAVELAASSLRERGGHLGLCTNCSEPLLGPYCAICGQPRDTHRRSVGHLLHDLLKDIASFDSRILRTVKALLLEPGELPLAFRLGRTQRYVPPVRLYLFVSLLFFLTLSVTGIAIVQFTLNVDVTKLVSDKAGNVFVIKNGVRSQMDGFKADAKGNIFVGQVGSGLPVPKLKADGSTTYTVATMPHFLQPVGAEHPRHTPAVAAVLAELKKKSGQSDAKDKGDTGIFGQFSKSLARPVYASLRKLSTDPAALNGTLTIWIPRVLFLLLPLFALLLAAFYRRQRETFLFVDHLVFSLSVHTFGFVLILVAAGLARLMPGGLVAWLTLAAVTAYLLLAMKKFYAQSWRWTGLKFVAVGVLYTVFFLLPAFVGVITASVLHG